MRQPDAAWLSDAHWAALTDTQQEPFAPHAPDFLIEVLSRTDSRKRLETKMQLWIDNGAQLAWMIDPYRATVSIYKPDVPVEVLDRPDFVVAGLPVAGFTLRTARLWAK